MKDKLITFIKHWEGTVLHVYKDSANLNTIGTGHLLKPGEDFTIITEEQANDILWTDLQSSIHAVQKLIHRTLNDNQMVALTSFTFNLGSGALQRSQVRMCINRGDLETGANKFLSYTHAGGTVIQGLVLRRKAERELFLTPE